MALPKGSPLIIGLYGISGAGKSYLLRELRQALGGATSFDTYDGSDIIASLVPNDLEGFKVMDNENKLRVRQKAIHTVFNNCIRKSTDALVTGHYVFWDTCDGPADVVFNECDAAVYTHLIYLRTPADIVFHRRANDKQRVRPSIAVDDLQTWQTYEETQLRALCRKEKIMFTTVSNGEAIPKLLDFFRKQREELSSSITDSIMGQVTANRFGAAIVVDADRTLISQDTGDLFWSLLTTKSISPSSLANDVLKSLFESPLGYSYAAFYQATLLYEEQYELDNHIFDAAINEIAAQVKLYPAMRNLLQAATRNQGVPVFVVTCGLSSIWSKILEINGLRSSVTLIAGGRAHDAHIVTPNLKAALVRRLQDVHGLDVWAFGDSPLDLEMLKAANHAVVVVGEEHTRSKSMDKALVHALTSTSFRPCQAILGHGASPRLTTAALPVIDIGSPEFLRQLMPLTQGLRVFHATAKGSARLLMAGMRNARISGPDLREIHQQVAQYLCLEYVTEILGLEDCSIPHVQGHQTTGHRLRNESRTAIIAIMRAGLPMALGVSKLFPLARLILADSPGDLTPADFSDIEAVLLVDSVINSGKTIMAFVQKATQLAVNSQIVILAGVVQANVVKAGGMLGNVKQDLALVTLRISDNQYTGRGETDTGNRLYNTTQLA